MSMIQGVWAFEASFGIPAIDIDSDTSESSKCKSLNHDVTYGGILSAGRSVHLANHLSILWSSHIGHMMMHEYHMKDLLLHGLRGIHPNSCPCIFRLQLCEHLATDHLVRSESCILPSSTIRKSNGKALGRAAVRSSFRPDKIYPIHAIESGMKADLRKFLNRLNLFWMFSIALGFVPQFRIRLNARARPRPLHDWDLSASSGTFVLRSIAQWPLSQHWNIHSCFRQSRSYSQIFATTAVLAFNSSLFSKSVLRHAGGFQRRSLFVMLSYSKSLRSLACLTAGSR
jgi:hypothetical protein